MGKSIKQKLREAEKQNHEAFRRKLVEDVAVQLEQWVGKVEQLMQRKSRENKQVIEKMEQASKEIDEVSRQLGRLNATTASEIKKLKQGRTWKFYLNTIFAATLASFFTILICAAYWSEIRNLFR